MISDFKIKLLIDFISIYPAFKIADAWIYDKDRQILYSPISESKLKDFSGLLPVYQSYIIINKKYIERFIFARSMNC